MDEIKTISVCPFNRDNKCKSIVDGAIHRCAALVDLEVKDPVTGDVKTSSNCSMFHQSVMMVEVLGKLNVLHSALQGIRNDNAEHVVTTARMLVNAAVDAPPFVGSVPALPDSVV